ncbi:Beta-glucosidase B [Vibrio nigripulchritudo SOn1]|uniref:Beta-glucosidase n=1 Tax=Vibrio nigripulchritudo SOn1 TaxID=1238450 RepID=A0AAV2VXR3_9VIBR|nr:GH1 family beta-glucosidase [Vibrio nigripulchritudo]CCO49537.1 Beta-glucosidase B [Vibrio nigripulchritudo SOn1]
MNMYQLPKHSAMLSKDFTFGVATSSYQIEGGVTQDGRCPSIWDTFCLKPNAVDNQDNGDIACDHYHLWKQDIQMIKDLGVDAYRLSMAWPRIIKKNGETNQAGLKFYEQIIDECHAQGLRVFVTLYHWDLPQYLEDRGGWLNRETAYKFAEYAEVVSAYFGNKIDVYTTLNEPFVSAFLGYRWGIHAPGIKGEKEGFQASHHLLLAHGLAMPYLRKNAPKSMHGIVLNVTPAYPETEADQKAADYEDAESCHWFMEPILKGRYPDLVLEKQANNLPVILEKDLKIISAPIDYLGINFYTRSVVRFDSNRNIQSVTQENAEHTYIGWEIYPQALTDVLLRIKHYYPDLPLIYITENGAAGNDKLENGSVNDVQRMRYYQSHFNAVDQAIEAGVQVSGYFAWSLMDNFEWAFGYQQRFGIVHVDYTTQKRTLKNSAIAYRNMLLERRGGKQNG